MGTDIAGFIEVREAGRWRSAAEVDLRRSYDLFGCLFGVCNYANFHPLFAGRGAPADSSSATLHGVHDEEVHSTTWFSLEEARAIDLDEEARAHDTRVHQYQILPNGEEKKLGKYLHSTGRPNIEDVLAAGGELRLGNWSYRTAVLTRRDALSGVGWPAFVDEMERFALDVGADNVRAVVFFDD